MQKVMAAGLTALSVAEVSDLLTHIGLQPFVESFATDQVRGK